MPKINLDPIEYRSPERVSTLASVPLAIQNGELYPLQRGAYGLKVSGFGGVATGGSNTTIVDAAKDFGTDTLNGKIVRVVIGEKEYVRAITDTDGSSLTIAELGESVACSAGCEYSIVMNDIGGEW